MYARGAILAKGGRKILEMTGVMSFRHCAVTLFGRNRR